MVTLGVRIGGQDMMWEGETLISHTLLLCCLIFFSHMCACMIKKKTQKQNKTKRQTTESLMVWGNFFDDIFNML